ncbi:hypothetical protein ACEQPO_23595 [Bacillus sp. SL00103]
MKKSYLSETVQSIQPSGIRKFFDLNATMESHFLGVGEPDFVTAWNVEASIMSLEQDLPLIRRTQALSLKELSDYLLSAVSH